MRLTDMIDRVARHYPERLALDGVGGTYTYKEMVQLTNRVAHSLRRSGFGVGTRFSIYTPNHSLGLAVIVGGMRAGAAWCNINLRNSVATNASILARGGCEVIFYHSSVSETVSVFRKECSALKCFVCLDAAANSDPSLMDFIDGASSEPLACDWDPQTQCFQGSTGGTTGEPKLTVGNADLFSCSAVGFATCFNYAEPPVNLALAPITHAAGLVALTHLAMAATVVLQTSTDVVDMARAIEHYRVTTLFLPPTLIYKMLTDLDPADYDFSSLKFVMSAAAPISPSKVAEAVAKFGPIMCQSYGQTETGMPITFMSPAETAEAARDPAKARRLGSIGRQAITIEGLEIMDDEGNILGPDQIGEIVVRAPSVMRGYLNDPEATREISKFGWHHTGDMGHRDADGYFYISDRKRDLIISGGFNIFPLELENVILTHPAVQDCAVVGVPDPKWGETVKAVLQLKAGHAVTAEDVIALVKEALGSMKAPRSVEFWPDLPRNAAGKVLKRQIRAHYAETGPR
jgi:acyl-CoA synthetase (AMP-forming)/AMP-acid ligase II